MSWSRSGFVMALAVAAIAGLALLWNSRGPAETLVADPGSAAAPAADDGAPVGSEAETTSSSSTTNTTAPIVHDELPTTTEPVPEPEDCTPFTTEIGDGQTTVVEPCSTTTVDYCDPAAVATTHPECTP